MNNRRSNKTGFFVCLVVLLLLLFSVGYAALLSEIDINGTTTVLSNSWNVYVSSVDNEAVHGSVVLTASPSIPTGSTSTTSLAYSVSLAKPGDYYTFDFTVKNGGTLDIKLREAPILTGLSGDQDVYINHTIKNTDGTTITTDNSIIEAGGTKTYRIKVEYDSNIDISDLPNSNQSLALKVLLNYIQK